MQCRTKDAGAVWLGLGWFLLARFAPPNVILVLGLVGLFFVVLGRNRGQLSLEGDSTFLGILLLVGILGGIISEAPWSYLLRDASYYLGPLLFFAIGVQLRLTVAATFLWRSFLYYVLLATLLTFGETLQLLVTSQPVSFEDLRSVLIGMEMQVPLAFMLLSFQTAYGKTALLPGKWQLLAQSLLLLRMALSFSRTMYVMLGLCLVIFLLCQPRRGSLKVSSLFYGCGALIIVGILIWWAPSSIKENFLHKLSQTFQEVSADTNWNIEANIIQNWRGYETSVAQTLFNQGSTFQKAFGFGFGQLIPVSHGELVGVSLEEGGITILHNGYYSMLIKVGFLGVGIYVLFFLKTLLSAWHKGLKHSLERPVVLYLSCAYLVATFVITGFFARGADPWLTLLFAYGLAGKKAHVAAETAVVQVL